MQEAGHELTALALQEETRVLEFDERYKEHIPIGTLVNLVQKGILYAESELLVNSNGELTDGEKASYVENFNLANALKLDSEKIPEIAQEGRFALSHNENVEEKSKQTIVEGNDTQNMSINNEDVAIPAKEPTNPILPEILKQSEEFVQTLKEIYELDIITNSKWSPTESDTLCVGCHNSSAKIIKFNESTPSDAGKHLIVGSNHELKHPFALSSTTGKSTNQVTSIQWSHDGSVVATAVENGEIRLWTKDGLLQNVFNFHRCAIVAIKWNEDSTHFLSLDIENVAILWNALNGTVSQHFEMKKQNIHSHDNESLGVDIEWVDKDKFVIPGPQGALVVYEMNEKKPIGQLIGHQNTISCIVFNRDNKFLASASDDFSIRIWHGASKNSTNCFYGHSQSITSLDWIDDDKIISSSMDGSIRVWSLKQNRLIAISIFDGVPILSAELSKDRTKYTVGIVDGQVNVYNIKTLLDGFKLKENQDKKNVLYSTPDLIPLCGTYQSTEENDNVFDLSWNHTTNMLSISYSAGKGIILGI